VGGRTDDGSDELSLALSASRIYRASGATSALVVLLADEAIDAYLERNFQ
jgi:hypothetical protein